MKNLLFLLFFILCSEFVFSQTNYFPLTVGDQKTFRDKDQPEVFQRLTIFDQYMIDYGDTQAEYTKVQRETWSTANPEPSVNFSHYLEHPCGNLYLGSLSEGVLTNFGSGIENPVGIETITIPLVNNNNFNHVFTIEYIGEYSVFAGTFQNCYRLEATTDAASFPHPQSVAILAPDIGVIEFGYGVGLAEPNLFELISYTPPAPDPIVIVEQENVLEVEHYHFLPLNDNFNTPKVLATSEEDEFFSICADGSVASSFTIKPLTDNNGNPLVNINNVSARLKGNGTVEELGSLSFNTSGGNTLEIPYLHPIILPEDSDIFNQITLEIYNSSNDCEIYKTVPIRVYRTPVLLVHGFLGTSYSFSNLADFISEEEHLIPEEHLKLVWYHHSSDQGFQENLEVIPDNIDDLIGQLVDKKISTGKVSIISHSMGGILARLYLQNDMYKNDIYKLITLNTPHYGSQFANLLLDDNCPTITYSSICGFLSEFIKLQEPSIFPTFPDDICNNGALNDLRVNSEAILELLNGDNINKNKIPSHSITTRNSLPANSWNKYRFILSITQLNEDEYNLLFNNDEHDIVVAIESQIGGIVMDATSLYDNIHAGSFNNSQVQSRIKELINISPNDLLFSSNGYIDQQLPYQTPASYLSGSNIAQTSDIQITSPQEGQIFQYMENIDISVSGDPSIDNLNIAIGGTPFNPDFSESIEGNSGVVGYTINSKGLGVLPIVVYGAGGNSFGQKTTYINVTTSSIPTSIIPSDKRMTIRMGKLKQPKFKGIFPDIGKVSIERDTNSVFNFKHGYAEHLGKGIIRGITPGTDTLTITFNGVESEPMKIIVKDSLVTNTYEIQTKNLLSSFEIFPNPTSDFVIAKNYLNKPVDAEFYVSDITGKIIQRKNVRLIEGENMTEIDLNRLQKGMYLISLKTTNGLTTQKVIKN